MISFGNKQEMLDLTKISIDHNVLPLLMDGMDLLNKHRGDGTGGLPADLMKTLRSLQRNEIIMQSQKTAEFLLFYDYLASKGLHPIVLKGIVCRSLYPQPEHRASADEDMLIEPAQFQRYHQAILDYGLKLVKPEEDIQKATEVAYENKESHLYVETHKALFDRESKAYTYLNDCFDEARARSTTQTIYGTEFHVLNPTDHLLYLILHALKHFLYSGFGIRQVCDIIMFSEKYRDEIDWSLLSETLEKNNAWDFARALLKIGKIYLLKENHMHAYLTGWNLNQIDEEPLLSDIMDGGLYGVSSMERLRASNMTILAFESEKPGRSVFKSVFLPFDKMRSRYPYLKKAPVLLPAAWVHRVMRYLKYTRKSSEGNAITKGVKSIRLGKDRIKLLEQYHII